MPGNPFAELLTRIDRLERALEGRSIEVPVWAAIARLAYTVRVARNTDQVIPTGGVTALSWNTEDWDYGDMWSSANPTRLYAPANGVYMVGATVQAQAGQITGVFRFGLHVRINGNEYQSTQDPPTANGIDTGRSVAALVRLLTGQYAEVYAQHTKGSNLTIPAVPGTPAHRQQNSGWMYLVRAL